MADFNWSDPCAAAAALSAAYYKVLSGGAAESVRFADREVRYTRANLSELRAEKDRMEDACAEQSGNSVRRRFAMTASSRRAGSEGY